MGVFDLLASIVTGKLLQQDPLLSKTAPLTKDEAWKVILKICVDNGLSSLHAGLIFSQGILESTHYTSNAFLKNNNAFGMKWSNSKFVAAKGLAAPAREARTAAQKAINFYAHYNTFADGVRDLLRRHAAFGLDWQQIKTPNDYISFLVRTKYFQGAASLYRSIVNSTFKKLNIPHTNG